ncbi:MAG: hypothetical protein NTY63_08805 [Candidatus Bipolaricaulota bacterium]|nr:hypothetical protein [Candidatus Bipolaricaulota bacterium]
MGGRTIGVLALGIALFGLSGLAAGPWSAEWTAGISLDPDSTLSGGVESTFLLGYATGTVLWTSDSEFRLGVGYLWQEFGVQGPVGAFEVQGDVLFGPSTTDFLYAQAIVRLRLAGVDVGFFYAVLGDAVLGGPADGAVVRLAGQVGGFEIASVTELGARIEDEEFHGVDIVHGATGCHRHYATDPVVPGEGFTGEKLSVGGLGFARMGNVRAIVYLVADGLECLAAKFEDVDLGISWIETDLEFAYDVEAKNVAVTPSVAVHEGLLCVEPHLGVYFGAREWEIAGFGLGGVALVSSWGGATIRSLTVLDPGRFVITTQEYGSVIESIEDAVENGDLYYPDYWELLSIEFVWGGCGGQDRILVDTYFNRVPSGVSGWARSSVETSVELSAATDLSVRVAVTTGGVERVESGITLRW